jgi:hypothetical protein
MFANHDRKMKKPDGAACVICFGTRNDKGVSGRDHDRRLGQRSLLRAVRTKFIFTLPFSVWAEEDETE